MIATARGLTADQRQTVQLPAGFELAGEEVWVRKDEATGEVTLSPKAPGTRIEGLEALFRLLDAAPLPAEFLSERANPKELPDNPLADCRE